MRANKTTREPLFLLVEGRGKIDCDPSELNILLSVLTTAEKHRVTAAARELGLNCAELTRLSLREALPLLLRKLLAAQPHVTGGRSG